MKTGTVTFLLVALLLIVSFAAYNGERFNTANPESGRSSELFVIGDTAGFPEGCDPITLTHIILDFFDAYNNGQAERFAEFLPPNFAGIPTVIRRRTGFLMYRAEKNCSPFLPNGIANMNG